MLGSPSLASDRVTWQESFMEHMRFLSLGGQACGQHIWRGGGLELQETYRPLRQRAWGSPGSRCCSGASQMALGQASGWVWGRLRHARHPLGAQCSRGSGTHPKGVQCSPLPKHHACPQRGFWARGWSSPSSSLRAGFLTACGHSGASQEGRGWALP